MKEIIKIIRVYLCLPFAILGALLLGAASIISGGEISYNRDEDL